MKWRKIFRKFPRKNIIFGHRSSIRTECSCVSRDFLPSVAPFSVGVFDYSSEEDREGGRSRVDEEADEFIKKFYDMLREQR